MKILKLLPVMLLLNCITICETSSAENILLFTASDSTFFNINLDDLKYDVEKKINTPLTEDEKKVFNNKCLSYSEDDETSLSNESGFIEFCKEQNPHSLRNLIDEYKSFGDSEDPGKWNLSDYILMRIEFLSEFFLKKFFLEIDEILITADQIKSYGSIYLNCYRIKTSLKSKGYNDEKIGKIFLLMDFLAKSFNEFMPGYYSIQNYMNIISRSLTHVI